MECKIDAKLPYTDLSTMIRRQRQVSGDLLLWQFEILGIVLDPDLLHYFLLDTPNVAKQLSFKFLLYIIFITSQKLLPMYPICTFSQ